MKYADKLKDHRWQKKRLEILDRDKWCCKYCSDDESTLHVHHLKYEGKNPWDASNENLITLCESCHDYEHIHLKDSSEYLLLTLYRLGLCSSDIKKIGVGFSEASFPVGGNVITSVMYYALTDKDILYTIYEKYFESLTKKKKDK